MPVTIYTFNSNKWNQNCYLIINEKQETLIIDPGEGTKGITSFIKNNELKPLGILNTHAHFDHIFSVKELQNRLCVNFYLHSKDLKLLKRANLYGTVFNSTELIKIPEVDFYIDNLTRPLQLGNFNIEFLHTPGHTDGSICLLIDDYLFTGDVLFKNEIGRIDLPGGDNNKMNKSLKLLAQLSPHLKIYPGHGESTMMEDELKSNSKFIAAIK